MAKIDLGVTVRDYFAGQAITGLASLSDNPHSPPISGQAVLAYKLADALIDAREEKQLGCTWTQDTDGIWKTSCGQAQEFTTGTREENGYKFCPYCGKEIQESKS